MYVIIPIKVSNTRVKSLMLSHLFMLTFDQGFNFPVIQGLAKSLRLSNLLMCMLSYLSFDQGFKYKS